MLKLGNALELFKTLDDGSIDCIITDPPYPTISGGNGGADSSSTAQRPGGMLSKNDGKIFDYNDIDIRQWLPECYRVLKPNAHIYIMTNFVNLTDYLNVVKSCGFDLHNLLIWEKNNATPNRWYMKNCEYIIFARKGEAFPINFCRTKTVLQVKNVKDKVHPTEKPVELMEIFVNNSTKPDEIVLDPFCGAGSTLLASLKNGRKYIGFEIDETFYNITKERLENFDPSNIKSTMPEPKPLTDNQKIILKILQENPDKDFSGKELAEITGLSSRTCSGCITPLCNADLAIKTNNSSPFRIKLKD